MARVGIDFGTGNTVLAVHNETLGRTETLEIPGISTAMRYRFGGERDARVAHVVPSLIHFGGTETLVGDQVVARGLAEHPDTFRWMKRSIAHGHTKRKRTAQGMKSPREAGELFLRMVLQYASDRIDLARDEITFTAPTEAFENFQDWLRTLAEAAGVRRLRMVDEPTACVLGYHGAARKDEFFAIYDHGCGTLDVSVVSVDFSNRSDKKAAHLGQAGQDLGGMDIDRWIAEDFCRRHGLDESDRQSLDALIFRRAEEVKIALSDPAESSLDISIPRQRNGIVRLLRSTYRRDCRNCQPERPGLDGGEGCLGCLLRQHELAPLSRQTLERALENAAIKAGVRRDQIARVLVTGGTSLAPALQTLLRETFGNRLEFASPFDAVARGACSGTIIPILQHDYSIESYDSQGDRYEFKPMFKIGTQYPTTAEVKLWARGGYEGQVRLGLKIFEVSQSKRRSLGLAMLDEKGNLRAEESRVETDCHYLWLNQSAPTFIVADPPVSLERDKSRFLCAFSVDRQRRLLVTVRDNLRNGLVLLKDHPVVRL